MKQGIKSHFSKWTSLIQFKYHQFIMQVIQYLKSFQIIIYLLVFIFFFQLYYLSLLYSIPILLNTFLNSFRNIKYIINIQDMDKITNSVLAKVGIVSGLAASVFLPPKNLTIATGGLFALATGVVLYLQSIWLQSEPNEWVLVIKDGKLVKSGIGLKTFVLPGETVVKFPSAVQRVQFSAKNVTKQMQGIQIAGIAFWSVYRQGDGPFKCYKYMQGGDANSSVRTMSQSIVRNQLANCSLNEVLTNRSLLRDNMKKDLQKQLDGWGIWLETVEITEVKICSNTLFEDLQADFRQETHLKAEQIRMVTNQKMGDLRSTSDLKIYKASQNNQTEIGKIRSIENLKRAKEEATYEQKLRQFEKRKLISQSELTAEEIKFQQLIELKKIQNEQILSSIRKQNQLLQERKVIEVDKVHNQVSLQKYAIDSKIRIIENTNVQDFKIENYLGNSNTPAAIFPGLQYAVSQGKLAR